MRVSKIETIITGLGVSTLLVILVNLFAMCVIGNTLYPVLFNFRVYDILPEWFLSIRDFVVSGHVVFYAIFPFFFGSFAQLACPIIGAPLIEEIEFRGIVWFFRNKDSLWLKIIISLITSIIFAMFHDITFVGMVTVGCVGLICSWIVLRTKSLWPAMILHSLYNCAVIFL